MLVNVSAHLNYLQHTVIDGDALMECRSIFLTPICNYKTFFHLRKCTMNISQFTLPCMNQSQGGHFLSMLSLLELLLYPIINCHIRHNVLNIRSFSQSKSVFYACTLIHISYSFNLQHTQCCYNHKQLYLGLLYFLLRLQNLSSCQTNCQ